MFTQSFSYSHLVILKMVLSLRHVKLSLSHILMLWGWIGKYCIILIYQLICICLLAFKLWTFLFKDAFEWFGKFGAIFLSWADVLYVKWLLHESILQQMDIPPLLYWPSWNVSLPLFQYPGENCSPNLWNSSSWIFHCLHCDCCPNLSWFIYFLCWNSTHMYVLYCNCNVVQLERLLTPYNVNILDSNK